MRRSGKLCLSLPLAPLLAKAPCECDGRLRTQVACFANAVSSLAQTPLATFVRNPVSDAAQIKSDHSSSQRRSSRQGRRQGTRPIRAGRKRRRAPEVARGAGPITAKESRRDGHTLRSGQGNDSWHGVAPLACKYASEDPSGFNRIMDVIGAPPGSEGDQLRWLACQAEPLQRRISAVATRFA